MVVIGNVVVGDKYVLPDGTTIAGDGSAENAWTDLTDGVLDHAINVVEDGGPSGYSNTWTGCLIDGTVGADTCLSWTAQSGGNGQAGWIEGTDSNWTNAVSGNFCNLGFCLYCFQQASETLAGLVSLSALAQWRGEVIAWETASEIDTIGFNLWRSDTEDGEYTLINDAFIPSLGTPAMGASYEYIAPAGCPTQDCFYKLEDIDSAGISTFRGPFGVDPSPNR